MNIIITPAIIARLEAEVCPTHGKSAKVFANNDMLSIREACCPEFVRFVRRTYWKEKRP